MQYKEIRGDVFSVPERYKFVQAISADLAMGKGIAVQFNKHFDTKERIRAIHDRDVVERCWRESPVLYAEPVYCLIDKQHWRDLPTYEDMENGLRALRRLVIANGHEYLAMPKIGCGLDGLEWEKVRRLVHDVFGGTDEKICVYHL